VPSGEAPTDLICQGFEALKCGHASSHGLLQAAVVYNAAPDQEYSNFRGCGTKPPLKGAVGPDKGKAFVLKKKKSSDSVPSDSEYEEECIPTRSSIPCQSDAGDGVELAADLTDHMNYDDTASQRMMRTIKQLTAFLPTPSNRAASQGSPED
jgi:hypothetical protein